jgi:ceramide glucosyltransferase
VARLRREFPALDIELVIEQAQCGSNRKVSNLMNMLPLARHEVLFVADSDTRVRPDYLSQLVGRLLAPRVGLVTCLYRCIPAGGLWSRLGAMYINDWYMPSVMLAWLFGHRRYVSGQTIALRRGTLEAAGGLRMLVNHLADDYELGERVRALGLKTVLSHYAAETVQAEGSLGSLIGHEVRWMRTLRALAPAAFGFLFVSFTLPVAALGYVLAAGRFPLAAVALAGLTLGARILVTSVPRLQQRRIPWGDVLLLPVRDVLLCWTWSQALLSSRVRWRGGEFEIDRHGVMRTLP